MITDNEYYLKVTSPTKALKEDSIYSRFCTRYEEGLALIVKGITSKGGIKSYNSVNRRIGRFVQQYPSVHQLYEIHIKKNEKDVCTSMFISSLHYYLLPITLLFVSFSGSVSPFLP